MRSSADINVVQIPPYLIDAMLPHIEGFLSVGMATGNLDGAKIAAELERGLEQLWVVFRDGVPTGVVLTSINKPADWDHYIDVHGMAGKDILSWGKAVSDQMTELAKAENCSKVIFMGRKALKRAYGPDVRIVGERDGTHIFERAVA